MPRALLRKVGLTSSWSVEVGLAVLALLVGALLLPTLIYYVGVASLGRYEGASLQRVFQGLYTGLEQGSIASFVVILGPYCFYLLFKVLWLWWRAPGPEAEG